MLRNALLMSNHLHLLPLTRLAALDANARDLPPWLRRWTLYSNSLQTHSLWRHLSARWYWVLIGRRDLWSCTCRRHPWSGRLGW